MTPSADIVRRWRSASRRLVRSDPALRRQRRRGPSRWRRRVNTGAMRAIATLILFGAAVSADAPGKIAALALLWTLCVLFSRSAHLVSLTRNPQVLWVPFHYPISDLPLFAFQRRAFLKQSLWIAIDWLAIGVGHLVQAPSGPAAVAIPVVAATQYVTVVGLAASLVWLWPRFPFDLARIFTAFVVFVGLQWLKHSPVATAYADPLLAALQHLLPFGWVEACGAAAADGSPLAWLALIAIGAGATVLMRWALGAVREHFNPSAIFGYETPGEIPTEQFVRAAEPAPAAPAPADREPAAWAIQTSQIRARCDEILRHPPGYHFSAMSGVQPRILQLLELRQRRLVDFLRPASMPGFARGWMLALGVLVLVRLAHWLGLDPIWAGLISTGAVLMLATPLFGGTWPGLTLVHGEASAIGLHAYFPVGFGEIVRLRLKLNALRIAAAWPLMLMAARTGFTSNPLPWGVAFTASLLVAVGLLAVQPIWAIAALSQGTNDTSARWWFTMLICLAVVGGIGGLIAFGASLFALEQPLTCAMFAAGILAYTHALLLIYGWGWRRGVFDLVAAAKR